MRTIRLLCKGFLTREDMTSYHQSDQVLPPPQRPFTSATRRRYNLQHILDQSPGSLDCFKTTLKGPSESTDGATMVLFDHFTFAIQVVAGLASCSRVRRGRDEAQAIILHQYQLEPGSKPLVHCVQSTDTACGAKVRVIRRKFQTSEQTPLLQTCNRFPDINKLSMLSGDL